MKTNFLSKYNDSIISCYKEKPFSGAEMLGFADNKMVLLELITLNDEFNILDFRIESP